jgi:hypothetical protein
MRNPMRDRLWRTIILTFAGLLTVWFVARIAVPRWPGFCDGAIVGAECDPVKFLTGFGYGVIVLGLFTMIIGPIIGSMLDVALNGSNWETPRGTESATTNVPLLVGAIYMATGLAVVVLA